jgi:beta-glucanase (GH16 family)
MLPGQIGSKAGKVAAADYSSEGYSLVFSDEFNGDSLNISDWNVEQHDPKWVNQELQRYTALDEGNIVVKDGSLLIKPHYSGDGTDAAVFDPATAKETYISFDFTVGGNLPTSDTIALQINFGQLAGLPTAQTPTDVVVKNASLKEVIPGESTATTLSVTPSEDVEEEEVPSSSQEVAEEDAEATDADQEEAAEEQDAEVVEEDSEDDISDEATQPVTEEDAEEDETPETSADTDDTENAVEAEEEPLDEALNTIFVRSAFAASENEEVVVLGQLQADSLSEEMLTNPGFDGENGWWCGFMEAGKGSCYYDNGAHITVEDAGTDNYHVQLTQSGIRLETGHTYRFTMTAVANTDKYTEITLLDPSNGYKWYGGGKYLIEGDTATTGGGQSEITSGRINTQGKHDFKYGRFEARAKVPAGQGYLPAFWLMASDEGFYGQWPKCGEIDIMEVMGQNTGKSYHTIHYGYNSGAGHKENQGNLVLGGNSFSEEFHVFRVDWEPGKITWFVDDNEVYSTNDWYTGTDDDNQITYPAPFDQNFYIILNLAVGGSWVGYPGAEEYANMNDQAYEIDYVRVYQKPAEEYELEEANVKKPEKAPVQFREPDATGNYVINGDFAKDIAIDGSAQADPDNWKLHLESDCEGTTYEVNNNAITISPIAVGTQNHSVQLKQEKIPVYKGWEYELTFDAYAAEDRNIVIDVEGPDRGWTRYMQDTTVAVGTEKKSYTYTFTMNDKTDANSALEFNLGNQGSTAPVIISNVRLVHKSGEVAQEENLKEIRPDGNYIYNGSFDQGDKRLGYWEFDEKDNIAVTNQGGTRELKVVVPEGSSEVVIRQSDLSPIGKGEYDLSFIARTTDSSSDGLTVTVSGKQFTPELSGTNNKFSKKLGFANDNSRRDSYVEITFKKPGTYYLDNIFLCESAILKNGSFNAGMAGFSTYFDGAAKANYVIDNMNGNDNTFAVTIEDTGDASADWYLQLNQDGLTIEQGKTYRFSIRMRSTIEREVSYRLSKFEGDWATYSDTGVVTVGPQWQTFENVFTMQHPTDTNTRFNVTFGSVNGVRITDKHDVYIDDIVLVEVTEDEPASDDPDEPQPEAPDKPTKPSSGQGQASGGTGEKPGAGEGSGSQAGSSSGSTDSGAAATPPSQTADAGTSAAPAKTAGAGTTTAPTQTAASGTSAVPAKTAGGSSSVTPAQTVAAETAPAEQGEVAGAQRPSDTTQSSGDSQDSEKSDAVSLDEATETETATTDNTDTVVVPSTTAKKSIWAVIRDFFINLWNAIVSLFR